MKNEKEIREELAKLDVKIDWLCDEKSRGNVSEESFIIQRAEIRAAIRALRWVVGR